MKIGIDVSPLYMSVSGISNYVKYLLQGFIEIGEKHSFVLYSNKAIDCDIQLPDNFSTRIVRLPYPRFQVWFQIGLPMRLKRDGVDVFLGPFHRLPLISGIPSVLTIHDLSGLLLKDYHLRSVVLRNSLIPLFLKKAGRIIAVSQFTANEITENFAEVENKIDVVLEAPAPGLVRVEEKSVLDIVRNDLNLPDRYILFLGTLEPRKNLPRLLEAYASIADSIPQDIVLAGRMGWGADELQKALNQYGIKDRIHLTGFVDSRQLPSVISLADLMAYPALYEGFGLPVVEAMACGTPVLTSSVSSLPEAAGGAALLADPTSVSDIAENLLKLAGSSSLRNELAIKGLTRASKLSWAITAKMTIDTCRRALEESKKKIT